MKRIILLVVFLSILLVSIPAHPAFAADRKMVSGTVCQPYGSQGSSHLRYYVRGVQAREGDITVVCPITRDRIGAGGNKKLKVVQVFYDKSESEQPNRRLQGFLFSCKALASEDECINNKVGNSGTSTITTIQFKEADELPFDKRRYFVYKALIPNKVILRAIYTEQQI